MRRDNVLGGTQEEDVVNPLQMLIRELMDAKGWGPADLARSSGLPRQTLYNLLSPALADERRQPRPATLAKMARALGVHESVLLDAMNETRGYDVRRVTSHAPDIVAVVTLMGAMPPEKRAVMVSVAKSLMTASGMG
jgi:transcriptional regulator with XRE-family HTH domain